MNGAARQATTPQRRNAASKTGLRPVCPVFFRAAMDDARVEEIFRRFEAASSEPCGELRYRNLYTLLVAVVLSAQATDKSVNAATARLFDEASTPRAMRELGEDALRRHIRTIGLYRAKARHIMGLSRMLEEKHGSLVPRERRALEALPGVGRKTANVVLNTGFGEPVIAVDTHIYRLAHRIGLASGKTPRAVEEGLLRRVPSWAKKRCHHWLILHGRYVCKARRPQCPSCLIRELCPWPHKTESVGGDAVR